jgi:hypothetical protein
MSHDPDTIARRASTLTFNDVDALTEDPKVRALLGEQNLIAIDQLMMTADQRQGDTVHLDPPLLFDALVTGAAALLLCSVDDYDIHPILSRLVAERG